MQQKIAINSDGFSKYIVNLFGVPVRICGRQCLYI